MLLFAGSWHILHLLLTETIQYFKHNLYFANVLLLFGQIEVEDYGGRDHIRFLVQWPNVYSISYKLIFFSEKKKKSPTVVNFHFVHLNKAVT